MFVALQELPEADRTALLMHVQDGLSYAAIASALGLSTAAVKVGSTAADQATRNVLPDGG